MRCARHEEEQKRRDCGSPDEGAAVLIATHDLESLSYADAKLRMNDGALCPA